MNHREDDRLPEELRDVAQRLRAERAELDPLGMDDVKRRVLTRARGEQQGGGYMKSRLATLVTVMALLGGTGGALAVADSGSGDHGQGSAAKGEYWPGKGCGDFKHNHDRDGCPTPHHKHHD